MTKKKFDELLRAAKKASKRAYCPYSRFPVGAAILSDNERVFVGCNVENASYGLTMCAERNAIFQMISGGEKRAIAIVIYTPTIEPTTPCGACRQVLTEFGMDAIVYSVCDGPKQVQIGLPKLIPNAFGPRALKLRMKE